MTVHPAPGGAGTRVSFSPPHVQHFRMVRPSSSRCLAVGSARLLLLLARRIRPGQKLSFKAGMARFPILQVFSRCEVAVWGWGGLSTESSGQWSPRLWKNNVRRAVEWRTEVLGKENLLVFLTNFTIRHLSFKSQWFFYRISSFLLIFWWHHSTKNVKLLDVHTCHRQAYNRCSKHIHCAFLNITSDISFRCGLAFIWYFFHLGFSK